MRTFADNVVRSPSSEYIADIMEARIRSGEYKNGRWLPSEREVSDEFGVSRSVIQSVIRELERRQLVSRSARCRPVVNSFSGASVAKVRTSRNNLGLWIWPGPSEPASSSILKGIYGSLDQDSYRLVVGYAMGKHGENTAQSEAQFLERIAHDRDIAGILLWYLGGDVNLKMLEMVRAADTPLVFLDRRPPAGFAADYVGVDNVHAAEEVVRHLIAQGHRRIAHITNMDTASTVAERSAGYRRALEVACIPYSAELEFNGYESGFANDDDVYAEIVNRLLALPDRPTALFAVNDVVALNLLSALRLRGLRVPEDFALAGFDGIERWMPGSPFLTTAEQPFQRIGAKALEILLQRIESGEKATYQHIVLEAPLRVYGSTAPQRLG